MVKQIEYRISELIEDVYKFNYDFDFTKLDKSSLQFQFEHSIGISAEQESLIITFRAYLTCGAQELVVQGVRATFITKPFENFVDIIKDDVFKVSAPELVHTFISVCIGAARGMLAKNLKGTALDGFVIPLVPMNVITENALMEK